MSQIKTAIAIVSLLAVFAIGLGGCTLPQGTREITAWGVGCIPTGGFCIPVIGYWHSVHGDRPGEPSAQPPVGEPVVIYVQ